MSGNAAHRIVDVRYVFNLCVFANQPFQQTCETILDVSQAKPIVHFADGQDLATAGVAN